MNFITSVYTNQPYSKQIKALQKSLALFEPFQFSRYSDGELFMILNKEIRLTPNGAWIDGTQVNNQKYEDHDCKIFIPSEDKPLTRELISGLHNNVPSFILGLPLPCCIGEDMFQSLIRETNYKPSNYSTANLLINNNYPFFVNYVIPILQKRRILLVANRRAYSGFFENLAGHIMLGDDAKELIDMYENSIIKALNYNSLAQQNDIVILFAASYLSNILINRLSLRYPHVTMIDIGTALHPQLNLGYIRHYLQLYYSQPHAYSYHECVPNLSCI